MLVSFRHLIHNIHTSCLSTHRTASSQHNKGYYVPNKWLLLNIHAIHTMADVIMHNYCSNYPLSVHEGTTRADSQISGACTVHTKLKEKHSYVPYTTTTTANILSTVFIYGRRFSQQFFREIFAVLCVVREGLYHNLGCL